MSEPLPMGADGIVRSATADGTAVALLWWNRTPTLPGETVGVVGGFQATSEAAAVDVLGRAGTALRARGCTRAVGPMDGNTWRGYRFVTDPGTEPPFLLEPVHPPEWPRWWQAAGFAPLAEYYSTATRDLAARDERVERAAARLAAAGVVIRPVDLAQFEAELGRIHDVSVISFQPNFLYTPLPREEFLAQYRGEGGGILPPGETGSRSGQREQDARASPASVLPCVPWANGARAQLRPELLLVAEQAGRPVGYVFTLPDLLQGQRGEPVTSVIVKTLAVLPGRAFAGLGAVLLAEVHAAARRLGFRRAIHALMHETNTSRNLSAHYAGTIRRYTLFSRRLAPT